MTKVPECRTFEEIEVDPPGMWDNEQGPLDWFAVSDTNGIFAYAGDEETAFLIASAMSAIKEAEGRE